MSENLTHMRVVHNIQTVISAIALYLVVTGWNSARELYDDLQSLQTVVTDAGTAVQEPDNLYSLVPELPDYRARLRRDLRDRRRGLFWRVEGANGHALPIELLSVFPSQSESIRTIWNGLQEQQWKVPTRVALPVDVVSAAEHWVDQWRRCSSGLRTHLLARRRMLRRTRVNEYTTPRVAIDVAPTPSSEEYAAIVLGVTVYSEGVRRGRCPRGERADLYQPDRDLDITREYKTFWANAPVRIESTIVSLPASTFHRHRFIVRYWSAIAGSSFAEALAWAAEEQSAGIRDRELRLMGAPFTGSEFGIVVPVTVFALGIYMLVMLSSLPKKTTPSRRGRTCWMAASSSGPALVLTGLTLEALPAVATGVAMWRLSTAPSPVGLMAGAAQLGLGLAVHYRALLVSGEQQTLGKWLTRGHVHRTDVGVNNGR